MLTSQMVLLIATLHGRHDCHWSKQLPAAASGRPTICPAYKNCHPAACSLDRGGQEVPEPGSESLTCVRMFCSMPAVAFAFGQSGAGQGSASSSSSWTTLLPLLCRWSQYLQACQQLVLRLVAVATNLCPAIPKAQPADRQQALLLVATGFTVDTAHGGRPTAAHQAKCERLRRLNLINTASSGHFKQSAHEVVDAGSAVAVAENESSQAVH